ncbi:E3 ubiquitin-protein ligase SHPRH isoform X1 [Rattus norvegicus]|uniref:E3 ubiquitin-protein ligase SHPRH isoform X1 n=1 Tax=Rattus norvegicus TaxID=10116 RepID=UPI002FD7A507
MSSRRKRAPPMKVDEERQQQLRWNMHEDLRNEPLSLTEEERACWDADSSDCIIIDDDPPEGAAHRDKKRCTESVSILNSTEKETPLSVALNVTISPHPSDDSWKAFLGDFVLQLLPEESLVEHFSERTFTLMSSESSSQLLIYVHSECNNVEKEENVLKGPASIYGKGIRVESSFSSDMLQDLAWLQKRRGIKLYQRPEGTHTIKVRIYLLEAGLTRLDFMSDAGSRMKKFNQLLKRVMGKLYSLSIPDVLEEDEEESESEPEGQDIDELYQFVKRTHQQEAKSVQVDVQHPALIPVLRPYQREAVNWMLQQEQFRSTPAGDNSLHFLWREIVTPDGLNLYYNPYTGCIIRDFPHAGPQLLGGILADEMGLGKTVEVLALILTHTRQDVRQDALTLPEGKVVNYFIPTHCPRGKVKSREIQNTECEPKEKVHCPPTRVMILTAVKEMNGKKGVSILSIYKYVSSTFRYDVQRNRSLLKRMLKCLIFEGLVKQIKGRGFSGTFTLGKNYKEDVFDKTKKQAVGSPQKIEKELRKSVNKDTDSEYMPSDIYDDDNDNDDDDDDDPYYYYCKARKSRKLKKKPVLLTKKEKGQPVNLDSQVEAPAAGDCASADAHVSESTCVSENRQIQDAEDCVESPSPAAMELAQSNTASFCETPDYRFECICGEFDQIGRKPRVQCLKCHLWQHAKCVNYEEKNLKVKPFYCPHCLVAMEPVSTRATLIISPSSICHQWVDEINRHVRSSSLRVLVYQGVKKDGFLQPHFLAEQDIVIITYDVLRSELNYVDIPHSNSEDGRRLRNQKRYMAIPSPLVAVEWWRICLDEAQMVECPTVKAAEMAQRLSGINRWCVSGTPVQRGLEDLFGLVVFLGIEPYCVKHWWIRLLYHPYCKKNPQHLYSFIAKIMWRSAKKDVIDQIQIPPQTEEMHWLHFSPVERHFYHRQHEVCCQDAVVKLRKISDWALKLSSLDRRTVSSILYPLLRLRQACCHPQAVRGEFLPLQKSTMTMEELLTSLQKKCGTECEEAHRQLVCALNGLAGIHIIKGRR